MENLNSELFLEYGEILVSGTPGNWVVEAGEGPLRVKTWEQVQVALGMGASWVGEAASNQATSDRHDTESLVFKQRVNQGWVPAPEGGFRRTMADNLDWLVTTLDGSLGPVDQDTVIPANEDTLQAMEMGYYSGELVRAKVEALVTEALEYHLESSLEFQGIDHCYTVEVSNAGEITLFTDSAMAE